VGRGEIAQARGGRVDRGKQCGARAEEISYPPIKPLS
jgi:hypothetical protein